MIVCSGRWLANTGSKEEELVSEGTLDRIGTLEDVARVVVRAHPCSSASALLCDQPSDAVARLSSLVLLCGQEFFAGPLSGFVTGQAIIVDGGGAKL